MPNQEQQKNQQQGKGSKVPFPVLPKSMEKRVSMKWLTLSALENVALRLEAQGGGPRVVLLTSFGRVEGRFDVIRSSYADSFRPHGEGLEPDIASMVTHVRSELLMLFEQDEKELQIVDVAPILSLVDVEVEQGGVRTSMPQLTLFADQVVGFSLAHVPTVH